MRDKNPIPTNPLHILLGWRGVFLAVFAGFILTACGGVSAPVNIVVNPSNSGVVDCEANPFDKTCGVEYALHRTEKINECLIDDMAGTSECAQAVGAQSCLGDPFADGCDENQGFSVFLEAAKDEREAFCSRDNNADDPLCVGAVATLCGDNPFYRLCTAKSYTDQQEQIVADCITDGKAGESNCAAAVKFNPCIRNPFTPECVAQTDFRTTREAFCRQDDNAANALCAGALAHFCELDPFDAICDEAAYSRQQSERAALCISDDNASNTALCRGAIGEDICISDPFTEACSTQDVARFIRESFCREGTNATDNPTLCGTAVMHFCTADPLDGLCDKMTQNMRLCTNDPFDEACDPTTYEMQRATRTTECITGDNARTDNSRCTNAIADDACIGDPYGTGCESKADARTARETYCRGNDNTALCAGAITHFCSADPFDGLCDEGTYSVQRGERVTECIAGDKANDPTCANAVKFNVCIRNPFTPECSTQTDAQTARKIFCDKDNNATNALCAGAVLHFCAIDPYDALCDENTYSRQQAERAALCIKDANASDADLCTGAIGQDECINNPFGAGCESKLTARIARETFCRAGNEDNGLCAGAVAEFCTADPFDSICKESNFDTLIGDRATRVTACITGDNANDDALCENAIDADKCILDPYAEGCDDEMGAQTARTTFCRAGNEGNALCVSTVRHVCTMVDPFDGWCDAGTYSNERSTHLSKCENGVVTVPPLACTNALAQGRCSLVDPFIAGCEGRINQEAAEEVFCRKGTNAAVRLSDCQNTINRVCGADPFDSICAESNFANLITARATRVTACIAGDKANDDTLCANAIKFNACIRDPYGAGCDGDVDSDGDDEAQTMRESHCRDGNQNTALCAGAALHFCTIDPYDALCNENNFDTLTTARATRITECITGDNARELNPDPRCTKAIAAADNNCIRQPYGTECGTDTPAQTARETYCRNNNSSNPLCAGAVVHFCDTSPTANPFDTDLCFDGTTYDTPREGIIMGCITNDSTRLNHNDCTNAVMANPCLLTPFNTNCETEFADYYQGAYQDARDKRETFCKGRVDVTYDLTLCAGAIVHVCEADPFETLCNNNNNDDYARQKMERTALCIRDDNASDTDLCMGAIGQDECINNPFGTGCDNKLTARTARESFCRASVGNENNGLCAGAVLHFCTADPFDDLCNADNFMPYETARGNRVTACIAGDNASDDALCANAIKDDSCILDPYDSACESKTTARMMREAHCRAGNEGNGLCMGAVVYFCDTDERSGADPFDGLCDPGTYSGDRAMRVTACIAGDKANDVALCANAVKFNPCIRDPYGAGCDGDVDSDGDDEAQTMRESHCRAGNNEDTPLCAGAALHFCTIDPYDALCNENNFATLTTARATRVATCAIGDNASNTDLCMGAIAAATDDGLNCITDPYATGCESKLTARAARESYCRAGNENNGLCAGAVAEFCTIDPYDDLCNMDNFAALTTARATRVTTCITGDNAREVDPDPRCTKAIAAADNNCIRQPYGVACGTDTPAQTARETYCRNNDSSNPLCAGAIVYFCDTDERNDADPFDGLCDPATYEMQRETRMTECENQEITNPRCTNALRESGQVGQVTCETHPYGATCKGNENDRMTRENHCRMDNNKDTRLCQGAVLHFCTIDPFDSLCNATNFTRYTEARRVFEGFCRADVAGRANDAGCANAVMHFCTADPFDSLCNMNNFTTFTDDRGTRDTLCRDNGNALGLANDTQCTGMLAHFCTIDPFDAVCDPATYDAPRMGRVAECIIGDNARVINPDSRCTNAIAAADNDCIRNPYGTECGTGTPAQTARETFCRGNSSNPLCAGAVAHFCDTSATSNPFDADLCFDGTTYDGKRDERTTFCAGQMDSSLDDSFCAGAIATNPCFNNPFVRDLDDGAYLCSSDFAARREEQISDCIVGNKGQDSECINVLAGVGGCLANPFQVSCEEADNLYFKDYADRARAARVAFCEIDITDHDYCFAGRMFERVLCTYNPYGSFCSDETFEGISTTLQAERTQKIIDCGDNDYNKPGSCVHVLARATAATWARGFDSPLNTQPTGTNEFLRAKNATHLDKSLVIDPIVKQLNLATSTFDYNAFGGDATDGVEFFQATIGRDTYYYAGILGAADLGEPLNGDARVMYWNGRISSTSSTESSTEDDVIVATDFILTITFDGSGGTLTSFAKVFLNDSENNDYYNINATFNERGLITDGTVVYAKFTGGDENSRVASSLTDDDATLSGIIGEQGALGVFQGEHFSGAFVAHPTIKARVETRDWVRGFGDTAPVRTPTGKNQFLQEEGIDGLDTSPTNAPVARRLTLNIIAPNFINDVSWFSGYIDGIQYHYAGLSASAYLGEPLNAAPASGTWYGKFGAGKHTTDFALDITFATGKIGAFVRESAGIYYLLAGDFNSAGVIRGTVNYGAFANGVSTAPVAGRTPNGVVTGLIGQGGVLGAFISDALGADGYAGGFWAAPVGVAIIGVAPFTVNVDYADWERSFLFLEYFPTAQNQFLGAEGQGIFTTGTRTTDGGSTVPTASTLNLLNATNFDNEALGGVNTNRVDWFSGYIGSTQYHYAGVFGGADLGDPLTETPAGGEWRGIIGVGGAQTDFTLTVTYGTAGGTISAFVRDTPNVYYLLEGGFDANGLIDGTVKYGEFTNRDKTAPVGNTEDGVLTGLIGMEGALGVFYSTATGAAGYSGGFVARPNAPEYTVAVKYSDYRRSFLTLASPDTTSPKNQFVTDATGVMTAENGGTPATENTLALDTTTFDRLALGGTADNSLFWFDGFAGDSTTRTYYAGLNELTTMGTPIVASGNWRGVFGVGSAKTDFTLNITYGTGGGTIAAFIRELEDNYYLLAGDFDASGLITGTVNYGAFTDGVRTDAEAGRTANGILTGLIGAEGAIGAFYSTATGPTGYSGGFVARDNVAAFDDTTVRYETWTRGFLLADTPDVSKPRNQFLRALTNTLDTAGSNNSITINLNTAKFNAEAIDGLATNSYQSFDRTIDGTSRHYLGILPDTDLGGRVPNVAQTKATWYGNFRGGFDGALAHTSDFVLHLTFDGTEGTLEARANYQNTNYYTLAGNFDAGGLITGTVAYTTGFEIDPTSNGILTGIIGANGAIGVFYGEDNSRNYGGGFVAKPKTLTFTDSVKYSDWVARANPVLTPTATNQFLQTDDKDISTGAATISKSYILSLSSTLFDDAPILGDKDDGLAYFKGTIEGTAYAYAGIFDSTDLGAPLTQSVTWNGVIGFNDVKKPKSTDFTIIFTGKGGTITAFLANIIATEETMDENDFLIEGTFDDLGLITGTVNYAEYTDSLATGIILNTPQAGVLSGIIGQDGAVGVFHSTATGANAYSGGFITSADVKEQVNISTWRDSFTGEGLYTTPNEIPTPQNQFLDGAGLPSDYIRVTDFAETQSADIITLGLGSKSGAAEATYKSIPLGGDNAGGIGYLRGFQSGGDRLYYGYLNNDSKIGTRIEGTTGQAEYHGQFRAWTFSGSPFETNRDFTLTVRFGTSTRGDAGDIDAFVNEGSKSRNSPRYYRLFGTYDSNGVITGEAQYGTFVNDNPILWVMGTGRSGLLSGIISKDNALGVFISGSALEERGLLTGGRGNDGFVGGFIARRFAVDNTNPNVGYTDWAQWFNPRPKADTTAPKNQFLTTFRGISTDGATAQPEDVTTATLNDVYYKPVTIPGDVNDGFSYFTAGGYSYVGILDSTDLGAPVQEVDGTAVWHGQLNFRNATGNFVHEFAININYGTDGGTVDGFFSNIENTPKVLFAPILASTANMTDFALNGDFNEYGVIIGTTNFAQYTGDSVGGAIIGTAQAGVLSGIIGQEGAVGVFHGLSQNTYVGGFVVHPQVVDIADVNYPDWILGGEYRTIARNTPRQFLQTENRIINTGLVDRDDMTVTPEFKTPAHYLHLNNITFDGQAFDGDENDGLGYFVANSYAIAGILDTTNLGAPLEQTEGTLLWSGQLDFITRTGDLVSTYAAVPISRDFVLAITFNGNGGTIAGSVENVLFSEKNAVFSIDGTFNSQGLINSGTTSFSTTNLHNGEITGIIGQEGAVGLFSGSLYAGGFVVHPGVTGRVSYSDWVTANPIPELIDGTTNLLVPIEDYPTTRDAAFLGGIYDSPFQGNHFLSTTNDVISVGGYLAGDRLITGRINRPSPPVKFPTRPLPSLNNIVVQDITPNYVRFDTASHNIESLRASDAIGGFAYFTGYLSDIEPDLDIDHSSTPHSYGGILDSTDLGPALTQTAGSVEWKGQLSFSNYYGAATPHRLISGVYQQNNDFTLTIEFNATGGKVTAFLANIDSGVPGALVEGSDTSTGLDIYLEGTFDKNGAISGNILQYRFANDDEEDNVKYAKDLKDELVRVAAISNPALRGPKIGQLSGLIGSHGAVGLFHQENAETSGGGGFIVAPPASAPRTILEDYEAWQASFDSAPATIITSAENRFLSGSDDTAFDNLRTEPNGGATPATVTNLNLNTTLYKGNALAGRTGNSVSFANGYFNDAGNTIRSFHALINAGADLGAVLPVWESGDTEATWKGVFAARVGNGTQTNADFDLTVDFRNRQIWAEVPVVADPRLVYRLSGVFPVDLDGVIIGTVIRTDTVSGNENPINALPEDPYPPAVLNGLIGEHGAIGVFISGSRADNGSVLTDGTGDTGYVGGFVACPYAGNQCETR